MHVIHTLLQKYIRTPFILYNTCVYNIHMYILTIFRAQFDTRPTLFAYFICIQSVGSPTAIQNLSLSQGVGLKLDKRIG